MVSDGTAWRCRFWLLRGSFVARSRWKGVTSPKTLPTLQANYDTNSSAYLKPEILHEWNDRDDLFTFIPRPCR